MKLYQKFLILLCVAGVTQFFLITISQTEELTKPKNKVCSRYPEERDIFIDNLIWQVLETPKGFVQLLNAYLDTRWNQTVVRVNANGPHFNKENDTIFCQFWFDKASPPYVVRASDFQILWVLRKSSSENTFEVMLTENFHFS